ncbi:PadR family transcriptional regulator [Paenibacillus sp. GYB003]|uniref:PadR family transcriptional regulator n=1 Tax=Paenibacillus sp. GYB003 TaxID=2994392 RepID=UPI002F96C57D
MEEKKVSKRISSEEVVRKEETLGQVVKVQQVIDFFVLSELQHGRRYQSELEQSIVKTLENVGVSKAYLSRRLQKMAAEGHVIRNWPDDERYNRYYEISESGMNYFKNMLRDLPPRVKMAQQVYKLFEDYIWQYSKMSLK